MKQDQDCAARRMPIQFIGLMEAFSAIVCVVTFTGFFGRLWWILELTVHFRPHYAVLLGGLTAAWVLRRRWRLAMVCGVSAMTNVLVLCALYWPQPTVPTTPGHRLRLAILNVHTSSDRSDLVLEWLHEVEPDLILLMEIDERWMRQLAPLRPAYPHDICEPRDDNFGIGLFSRIPLRSGAVVEIGDSGTPSIEADLSVGDGVVHITGTHALPPSTSMNAHLRNGQFADLAKRVRQNSLPVVLCGDLNVTPWSPWFAGLLREANLRNSAQGRGLSGSWPAWLPVLRLPIDHCLVSDRIEILDRRVGRNVGSDHLPVLVDVSVPVGSRLEPQQ